MNLSTESPINSKLSKLFSQSLEELLVAVIISLISATTLNFTLNSNGKIALSKFDKIDGILAYLSS